MIRRDGSHIWVEVKAISLNEYSFGQELITSNTDVTERVEAERRYNEEIAYREISLSGCFAVLHCDLTDNTVLRQRDISSLTGVDFCGDSFDGIIEKTAAAMPESARDAFLSAVSREALLASFAHGRQSGMMYIFSTVSRIWLRFEYYVVNNPGSGHTEAIIYTYSAQRQVLSEKLVDILSTHFFDYISCIDVETGMFEIYYYSDKYIERPPYDRGHYPSACEELIRRYADSQNADAEIAAMNLDRVKEGLGESAFYTTLVHLKDDSGKVHLKKLTYTYLDESHTQIILAQSDVRNVTRCVGNSKKLLNEVKDERGNLS